MDQLEWINSFGYMTSIYAFDILPDGSFSEIRLMAVNPINAAMLKRNPKAPPFYPGIPWRSYFTDINFESFCYQAGSTAVPLYSYVNAHGFWLKGFYIPLLIGGEPAPDGTRTVYVLYVLNHSKEMQSDAMTKHSAEVSEAVIDISIKLHETQDFYQAMADANAAIRRVCGAEQCSLLIVDQESRKCELINEFGVCHELLAGIAQAMKCSEYEVAQAWERDLAGSDCMLLEDLSVIKERDPAWYASLEAYSIKSIVFYAVRCHQQLVGFIWAANFDTSKMMQIKETLELTSFLLAAVIANHLLVHKLEQRSTIDSLTQVGSRNAMDDQLERFAKAWEFLPETMGVVYADLNGLKTVNDEKGHDAGDKLLSRAAALLKIAFGDYDIYRAGGDEFVIFCPEITEEELNEHVAQLRGLTANTSDVRFAVGAVFCSNRYDINQALQTADERMYLDKEEYYRRNPDKCRRKNTET